jgi:hypothetical protein
MKFNHVYRETKAQQFTKSELKPYKNPKQKTFEVTVVHMHGDADNYTTDVHDFKAEDKMLDFVNFILRCMVAYPNGMGGDDRFDEVEGCDRYEDYLHRDNDCLDGHATPDAMDIVYFDADSVKWDVELSN